MSAVTILGVEVKECSPEPDDHIFSAATIAGDVIVFPRGPGSWLWELDVGGTALIRAHAPTKNLGAACDDATFNLERLLAIGRAQGLREGAEIARTTTWEVNNTHVIDAITAAAERAERGGGG